MKQHLVDAIEELRDSGHVVIIWTPEEVKDVSPDNLEDYVISKGNDYIEDCS